MHPNKGILNGVLQHVYMHCNDTYLHINPEGILGVDGKLSK